MRFDAIAPALLGALERLVGARDRALEGSILPMRCPSPIETGSDSLEAAHRIRMIRMRPGTCARFVAKEGAQQRSDLTSQRLRSRNASTITSR